LKKNDSLQDLQTVFYLTIQKVDIKHWISHTPSQVYPNAKGRCDNFNVEQLPTVEEVEQRHSSVI